VYGKKFNVFEKWGLHSPTVVRAYIAMDQEANKSKVLTPAEIQAIQLTVSAVNRCLYCMHFHTTCAMGAGVSEKDAKDTRDGGIPGIDNPRLRNISRCVKLVMTKHGNLTSQDRHTVRDKWGISDAQLYEICMHVGLLIAANYCNLLDMPVTDSDFASGAAGSD